MSIQFPNNPTDGQVYSGYYYDATLNVWKSSPIGSGPVAIASTAPEGAIHGDMWFNNSDGTMYTYYVDGDTSQWVEVRSQIARNQVGLTPITPTSVTVGTGTASVASNGTVSFTGATNVWCVNVFSSSFRNYRVMAEIYKNTSADDNIGIQLGNGTTESSTLYSVGCFGAQVNSTTTANYGGYQGAYASLGRVYYNLSPAAASIDLFKPYLATATGITGVSHGNNAAIPFQYSVGGRHEANTSYASLKFLITGNTMTGTLKIYGYN